MDRKQPLLLILMITLFGIAIAGAIWIFSQRNIQVRRDSILVELQTIAADAIRYRTRPATLGGGGGKFVRYSIPAKLRSTGFAEYEVTPATSPDTIIISAIATQNIGTLTARIEPTGVVRVVSLTGELGY